MSDVATAEKTARVVMVTGTPPGLGTSVDEVAVAIDRAAAQTAKRDRLGS